jgi:hypothetical protein
MEEKNKKQYEKLKKILLLSGIGIGAITMIRKTSKEDMNNENENYIVKLLDNNTYDGWLLTHFMLHFSIGAKSPEYWYSSIALSLSWEYVEKLVSEIDEYWLDNANHDIKVNTLGLVCGMLFNKL